MTLRSKALGACTAIILLTVGCAQTAASVQSSEVNSKHPNIVLVMTDDQGYGDIGALGNPLIHTPNIDALHGDALRLTDFHVDPTCSPTRSALLTGQSSMRAGVWHTVMGRSLLATEKTTIAEYLSEAGYKTAMFGKWHLGDNYPYRPEDQGFQKTVIHGGGGVGQTPDYWGNTQFDDTYYVNGEPTLFAGNSTDVWFDEAEDFIQSSNDAPVFAYVALNAPHTPWRAPQKYVQPYADQNYPPLMANFYGMISHIDERVGKLRSIATDLPNGRPTYFIFMTDNGSSFNFDAGKKEATPENALIKASENPDWVVNAGMRGYKASVYEGGHRVPFFITGPDITGGRDVDVLSAHFDILPTLLDLADVDYTGNEFDGESISRFLTSEAQQEVPDRALVVTNQRVFIPSIDRPTTVMTERWRYVSHGEDGLAELFDIIADPSQTTDISTQHPAILAEMKTALANWWAPFDLEEYPTAKIPVGNPKAQEVRLTSMDWMEASHANDVAWFPNHPNPYQNDRAPKGWIGAEDEFTPFPWYLDVQTAGKYKVQLYLHDRPAEKSIGKNQAALTLNNRQILTSISPDQTFAEFTVDIPAGFTKLTGWFEDENVADSRLPTFYTYVTKLRDN